jgi:hypothetical protein
VKAYTGVDLQIHFSLTSQPKPAGTVVTVMKTSNLAVRFYFTNGSLFSHVTASELFARFYLLYFYWVLRRRADGCLPAVISLTGNNGLTIICSLPAQYQQQNSRVLLT